MLLFVVLVVTYLGIIFYLLNRGLITYLIVSIAAGVISNQLLLQLRLNTSSVSGGLAVSAIPLNLLDFFVILLWGLIVARVLLVSSFEPFAHLFDSWLRRCFQFYLFCLVPAGIGLGFLYGTDSRNILQDFRHPIFLILGVIAGTYMMKKYSNHLLSTASLLVALGVWDIIQSIVAVQRRVDIAKTLTLDTFQAGGAGSGAAIFALTATFSLWVTKSPWLQKWFFQYILILLGTLQVFAFSDSPTSILIYGISAITSFGVVQLRWGDRKLFSQLIIPLVVFFLIVVIVIWGTDLFRSGSFINTYDFFVERLSKFTANSEAAPGVSYRQIAWNAALNRLQTNPIAFVSGFGLGAETSPTYWRGELQPLSPPGAAGFYLLTWGLVGAVLLFCLLGRIIWIGLRLYWRNPSSIVGAYGLMFCIYGIIQIVISPIHGSLIKPQSSILLSLVITWLDTAKYQIIMYEFEQSSIIELEDYG